MATHTTTAAQILAAAQKMHDAADDLHALLATAGAVHARILLDALAGIRRGANDLQQFAADLAEDQRAAAAGPVFEFDSSRGSLAEYLKANADDTGLCEWLPTAAIGDTYAGCTRIA